MFESNGGSKSDGFPSIEGHSEGNFWGPTKALYFAFKLAGNLAVIKTIREVCVNPDLESLDFACTGIDDDVIDTIIQYLIKKKDSSLKELNLSGNNFTDVSISRLLDAIERNETCKLQNLNLLGNKEITPGVLQRAEELMQKRKSARLEVV